MSRRAPKFDELITVRVMREQAWAYGQRLLHLSYREMRARVIEAPPLGLGYDISEQALKALVTGYLVRMRETLQADREEMLAREIHDLDIAQRRVDALFDFASQSVLRAAELGALDVHGSKVVLEATRERRAISESRRRLLGLDQPVKVEAEVTHRDAVTEELNAMLARAGRPPIEVPE